MWRLDVSHTAHQVTWRVNPPLLHLFEQGNHLACPDSLDDPQPESKLLRLADIFRNFQSHLMDVAVEAFLLICRPMLEGLFVIGEVHNFLRAPEFLESSVAFHLSQYSGSPGIPVVNPKVS